MVRYRDLIETVDQNKIKRLLVHHFLIGDYEIDENGYVSTAGKCQFVNPGQLHQLPVKFLKVQTFHCYGTTLTSLKGSPVEVKSDFSCARNKIPSLVGGPKFVVRNFLCSDNRLKTLQGGPTFVGDSFYCQDNPLESLDGLPQSGYKVILSYTPNLGMLRLLKYQTIMFDTKLTALLDHERMYTVLDILNKYKGNPTRKDILSCQKELIDAGFEGNASW